ncbi:glycosyltransferase family 2 protein [Aggregatibacter segnis]|uniref:glycosyltransferase family 2 protein n=1 Tax=Aggregatibacter segnis TaxID=739 RepID=UPI000D687D67|nr:glycosyltransferase [Aggregatibacter segnis]
MPKITFAIATYNRQTYIDKMLASLKESVNIENINVRIYDDHSTEISEEYLAIKFPFAKSIIIREYNLGADRNSIEIYKDFLKTGDEILVNADSDLIYRPNWLEIILENLPKTDGVLSLYNSNKHPFINENNSNELFGEKLHLGNAGTVLSRSIVEKIINNLPDNTKYFDWEWSSLLKKEGIKLYCLYESYIQHIGILGQNNKGLINDFDYGINFIPESKINQIIISNFIDELFKENKEFIDKKQQEIGCKINKINKLDYKLGHAIMSIPRELMRLFHKILK